MTQYYTRTTGCYMIYIYCGHSMIKLLVKQKTKQKEHKVKMNKRDIVVMSVHPK